MKKRFFGFIMCLVLILGLIPAGLFTIDAAAEENDVANGDYSSWDKAYIATDSKGLQDVFCKERSTNTKVYIKLGCDINYTGYDPNKKGTTGGLVAYGSSIYLDLCGHTLSANVKYDTLIYGYCGTVSIHDTGRYDPSTQKWISGRVEYKNSDNWWGTCVLKGKIFVYGGTFVNLTPTRKSQYPESVYQYDFRRDYYLKMYNGVFEADVPVYVRIPNDRTNGTIIIDGGTFRVKRDRAFYIDTTPNGNAKMTVNITKCSVVNASGNDKVQVFGVGLSQDYVNTHTYDEIMENWYSMVPAESRAYVDGDLRPEGVHGISFNYLVYIGPSISDNYKLTKMSYVDEISLDIMEPAAGNHALYIANAPEDALYQIKKSSNNDYWRNGVLWWSDGKNNPASNLLSFDVGKSYTVYVDVEIKSEYGTVFADKDSINATINGHAAKVVKVSDTNYLVYCTFEIGKFKVNKIDIKMTMPLAGEDVYYHASVASSAKGYGVADLTAGPYKNGVMWEHGMETLMPTNDEVFSPGDIYSVSILVEITDPDLYEFGSLEDIKANVNGDSDVTVSDEGNGYFKVSYSLTIGMEKIKYVSLTIPELTAGALMPYSATAPAYKGYAVDVDYNGTYWANGVSWLKSGFPYSVESETRFEESKEYTVRISIILTDESRYLFANEEDMVAEVNGTIAEVEAYWANNYVINCAFTVPEAAILLGDADGDGEVTDWDSILFDRFLAGWNVYCILEAMDLDADGEVSDWDSILLARYLAGWKVTFG